MTIKTHTLLPAASTNSAPPSPSSSSFSCTTPSSPRDRVVNETPRTVSFGNFYFELRKSMIENIDPALKERVSKKLSELAPQLEKITQIFQFKDEESSEILTLRATYTPEKGLSLLVTKDLYYYNHFLGTAIIARYPPKRALPI